MPPFVRGQQRKAFLAGQLDVDGKAVGQIPQLLQQLRAGPRDGLGVDVAAKVVFAAQQAQHRQHPLGGVVGVHQHGAGEE